MAIADKLAYLGDTKQLLRQALEGVGQYIPNDSTTFREYVTKLVDSQRTLGLNFAGESYDLLNPINDVAFADELTFTRGSTGTYWDRQGVLQTAAVDEERITHDPSSLNSSVDTFDLDTLVKNDIVTVNLASTNTYSLGDVIGVSDDTTIANHFYALIVEVVGDVLTCQVTSVGGTGSISAWTVIKSEGLLIEEQRTNLLTYSVPDAPEPTNWTDFVAGSVGKTLATLDNGIEGIRFQSSSDRPRISQNVSCSGSTTYTASVYVNPGWSSGTPDNQILRLLSNGTSAPDVRATLDDVGSENRVSLSITTPSDATTITVQYGPGILNNVSGHDVTMGGVQLEQGSFPTSYIKTEASQVTRSADNCSRTLGSEFNASEGNLTVTAKAEIGDTIATLGTESIAADVDTEKDYTLNYSSDPSATTIDIMPSANGYIKSLRYIPREVV